MSQTDRIVNANMTELMCQLISVFSESGQFLVFFFVCLFCLVFCFCF